MAPSWPLWENPSPALVWHHRTLPWRQDTVLCVWQLLVLQVEPKFQILEFLFFWKLGAEQSNNTLFKTHTKKILTGIFYLLRILPYLVSEIKQSLLLKWETEQNCTISQSTAKAQNLSWVCVSLSPWLCLPCSNCFGCKPRKASLSCERPLVFTVSLPLSLPEKQCQLMYIENCAGSDWLLIPSSASLDVLI